MGKEERLLRGAIARTHDKKGRLVELKRPLQRLFPIELNVRKEVSSRTFVREAKPENTYSTELLM